MQDFINWAQALGAAGTPIFVTLFLWERNDRKKAEAENRTLARDVVTAMVGVDRTLSNVAGLIGIRGAK
jgi:hypothetical protein